MEGISIHIPQLGIEKYAEVEVTINGKKKKYNYRVEMFEWEPLTKSLEERISGLRQHIEGYDKQWELIQIYNPSNNQVPVLFRQKQHKLGLPQKSG